MNYTLRYTCSMTQLIAIYVRCIVVLNIKRSNTRVYVRILNVNVLKSVKNCRRINEDYSLNFLI